MFEWCLFKRIPGFGSFTTGAGGYDFIQTVIVGNAYDIVMNTLNMTISQYYVEYKFLDYADVEARDQI